MAADMTTKVMLDDVNLTIEAGHVTSGVYAIAGYVNGSYANWPQIVAKWGKAGKYLLSIDTRGDTSAGAQCLDVEAGDVSPTNTAAVVAWVKATAAAGKAAKDLRWYPKVYTSESNAASIVSALSKAGVARNTYMLWTAHYSTQHICGPSTCGCPVQADATQWTDSADGVSLDQSLCYGYFFAGPGDTVPAPVTATGGSSASSTAVSAGTPAKAALEAPTGLKAYPSYRGVTVTWDAVKGATDYDVQLLDAGKQVGRTTSEAVRASFPVKAETSYTFRVASLPGGGWSEELSFKTPAAPAATEPSAPVTAPTSTTEPTNTTPSVVLPQPTVEPVEAPSGAASVLVYVQEILTAEVASKFGLPAGTILFIPHTVEA